MTEPTGTLAARDAAHLIHPVTPPREMTGGPGPRIVVDADGWWLTDDRGRRIIDGFAGLWCVAVGHGRPEIVDAVHRQMQTLEYFTTFHGQSHPRAIELAERIAALFPPEHGLNHVMFGSGGSEANETNFKIVRLYRALRGEDRRKTIVARHHGYHGLTIATMTATGIMPMHWNFGPEPPGFAHVAAPYCYRCELGRTYPECDLACARSLEDLVEAEGPDTIAAFIAEPVIGAGGIIPPPPDYFPRIREICDRYGILLVVDEVVTGFGRTGTMFGFQQWDGVRPDIVTLAKGLTSGYLPLGASVVSDEIWDTISARLPEQMPFSHGYTYSGHPACCAAALANLDVVEAEDLPANAARVGAHLMERMRELERFDSVGEVRGMGLMVGVELVADKETKRGFTRPHGACSLVEHEAWERGLYARAMGTEVVGARPAPHHRHGDSRPDGRDPRRVRRGDGARADAARAGGVAPAAEDPGGHAGRVLRAGPAGPLRPGEGGRGRDRAPDGPRRARRGIWTVAVRDSALEVRRLDTEVADATCTIRMRDADYVAMVNGDLPGDQAFVTQKLRLEGDMSRAAELMGLGIL
ncbi:MAG: aminotransferase class III-fold pyridoxal phosphate-dependent enzyme [Acidimicrobiia bacterium]|nr:aminotransferase class III-fold pyridoxal phosphate-dependent enzyme [Acidimicrobiia bacterium]